VFRRLNAGSKSSVRGTSSTLGGKGRRAKSCGMAGCWVDRDTGEGLREMAGVTVREGRGLFLDRGLDGAWRKSSGMSFQFSMAEGVGVVLEGTRVGADTDFGGGGGRFVLGDIIGGAFEGCTGCLSRLGFFSQLFNEDCIAGREGLGWS
jgi:hypothetical protein